MVGSITPERRDPARAAGVDLRIEISLALTSSGGYLNAIAHRGARLVEPEPALEPHVVDLDDHTIDLVLDVVAVLTVVLDELLEHASDPSTTLARSLVGRPHARSAAYASGLSGGLEAQAGADARGRPCRAHAWR